MPSLVSADEIASFTGDYQNLFDTFKREFTIIKAGKKKILSSDVNTDFLYPGYDSVSQKPNTLIQYEMVSGIYYGMIRYPDSKGDYSNLIDVKSIVPEKTVRLKVQDDARKFITQDKTDRILIDEIAFKVMGGYSVKYFFGIKLYVFELEQMI